MTPHPELVLRHVTQKPLAAVRVDAGVDALLTCLVQQIEQVPAWLLVVLVPQSGIDGLYADPAFLAGFVANTDRVQRERTGLVGMFEGGI